MNPLRIDCQLLATPLFRGPDGNVHIYELCPNKFSKSVRQLSCCCCMPIYHVIFFFRDQIAGRQVTHHLLFSIRNSIRNSKPRSERKRSIDLAFLYSDNFISFPSIRSLLLQYWKCLVGKPKKGMRV